MRPLTIDFEASCLPCRGRSYPIEVGIADAAGNSRSWLIRPHVSWRNWIWAEEAARIHGIGRAQLETEGCPADQILDELCAIAGDRKLVAESWLDADWLATLCEAAGQAASFSICHVANLLDMLAPGVAEVRKAEARLATMAFQRHRAADDARYLALWLGALEDVDAIEAFVSGREEALAEPALLVAAAE